MNASRQATPQSDTLKVACIQNCAGGDMAANLDDVAVMVASAAREGAGLICLPEYFSCLDVVGQEFVVGAGPEAGHPALHRLSDLARDTGAWILVGSIAVTATDGRICNRSLLVDDNGAVVSRYDKIHLFDVDLGNGESYRESATICPGDQAVIAETPWGGIGLTVCYDLRFPQLYRALAKSGAGIITVPAAFAKTTGQAHWHVLLRARAIETGCFIVAPCQTGTHGTSQSYGHSLIVDPWGAVLADGGTQTGIVMADLDLAACESARGRVPALTHDRPFTTRTDGPLRVAAT